MPYTTPHTITVGELVTVDTMNDEWGGNVAFLANPPACRVYHNTTQSISNSTKTALSFNSERYDTDTMHDTATNNTRLTIKTAGLYIVTGHAAFAGNSTGDRSIIVRLGGATEIAGNLQRAPSGVTEWAVMSVATIYRFAVNEYVELLVYQTSGGALSTTQVASLTPEFAATWIGLG